MTAREVTASKWGGWKEGRVSKVFKFMGNTEWFLQPMKRWFEAIVREKTS
jgi:hypothetical protein